MTARSDDRTSWAVSIGTHALLFLLALLLTVQNEIPPPSEVELLFAAPAAPPEVVAPAPEKRIAPTTPAITPAPAQRRSAAPARTPAARTVPRTPAASAQRAQRTSPTPQRTSSTSGVQSPAQGSTTPPKTAPVPPRPRSMDAVDFAERGSSSGTRGAASDMQTRSNPGVPAGTGQRRETTLPGIEGSTQQRDKPGTPEGTGTQNTGELSATPRAGVSLDWGAGASRTRISGQLPAFPRDAQRSAQVRARFRVRPDGTVYAVTIVQKAAPAFDDAVLAAVRAWRFNPLPANSGSGDQEATGVFNFRLQ